MRFQVSRVQIRGSLFSMVQAHGVLFARPFQAAISCRAAKCSQGCSRLPPLMGCPAHFLRHGHKNQFNFEMIRPVVVASSPEFDSWLLLNFLKN